MRLIDADKLKVLVAVENDGIMSTGKLIANLFEDMQTVDAIPIDWIIDWHWKNSDVCCDGHVRELFGKMIKDWREENEQRQDS